MNMVGVSESDFDSARVAAIMKVLNDETGYDYTVYAETFIRRRLNALMSVEGLSDLDELLHAINHDRKIIHRLLQTIPIYTTEMFRDPEHFLQFRNLVVPVLRTYPYLRIWHAGCSTGEEAYSMAILLQEEGLYDRTKLYATDLHEPLLEKAKSGIYPMHWAQRNRVNYVNAGGKKSFDDYYTVSGKHIVLDPDLRRNIVFAQHNLTTDGAFNEFNVVMCRNVLIYFNFDCQARVHQLLRESLMLLGVLGLGSNESIRGSKVSECYKPLAPKSKLYQRIE